MTDQPGSEKNNRARVHPQGERDNQPHLHYAASIKPRPRKRTPARTAWSWLSNTWRRIKYHAVTAAWLAATIIVAIVAIKNIT